MSAVVFDRPPPSFSTGLYTTSTASFSKADRIRFRTCGGSLLNALAEAAESSTE